MARMIYIVNATQVVTSDSHPEGLLSVMSGYPQYFDSRNYNRDEQHPDGDSDRALEMAESVYYDQVSKNKVATNRAMTTVTLDTAMGRRITQFCKGNFPVIQPEPEPEEPEEEPEAE